MIFPFSKEKINTHRLNADFGLVQLSNLGQNLSQQNLIQLNTIADFYHLTINQEGISLFEKIHRISFGSSSDDVILMVEDDECPERMCSTDDIFFRINELEIPKFPFGTEVTD